MQKKSRNKLFAGIVALLCAILLAVGATSMLAAGEKGSASPDYKTAVRLAKDWAEGWRTRDGALRTAVMSDAMLKAFRADQLNDTGDANNTVIRDSSPWVTGYSIQADGKGMRINYTYADSSKARYSSSERLSFSSEHGRTVVSGCKTLQELTPLAAGASR